ncbi:NAD(P)-binding protein [Chryseobacterium sp. POL2]|uniref:NAD(P)-binding protein n=1 Tax=Chryseobacterium sp. POL2 TaxID=2713414 RepID=UPI0016290458|nr:FAD/NAD(P)-binding protein [Chryseobacterium sp. POL2]
MKSGEGYNRRGFVLTMFWGSMMLPFLQFCSKKAKSFLLKITGTNHILGHRLWAKDFPKVSEVIRTEVLIVGSGISGLSAARELSMHAKTNFLICEMESFIGGNSSNGENKYSKYPRGAHYLPLPNKDNQELIDFLKEAKIYLGDDEYEDPILDDYQLVFPQDERLFFKNAWQNDIIPQRGLDENSKQEFDRFFKMMNDFKLKKDDFGKFWFTIPSQNVSQNEETKKLDNLKFKTWLDENDFKSQELLWYLDYACKDDYGLGIEYVSAWAGINYFAGRKHDWAPKKSDQVMTWPEGNARLSKHLAVHSENKILKQHLVFDVIETEQNVEVLVFDNVNKKTIKIVSDKLIMATPQFVNNFFFKNRKIKNFTYVPWLLATLTLDKDFGGGEELAWDNVIYGGEGLGYIYDQHQNISQNIGHKVITYYRSFSTDDSNKARKQLFKMKEEDLKELVLKDFRIAHPLIDDFIIEIEFNKIGHAMIAPTPGKIFGKDSQIAKEDINRKIFFAHSDLSGISIFEEAFYQGIYIARKILS